MYIKISCGGDNKYVVLQSNKATIDKKTRRINGSDFIDICAFLVEVQKPYEEQDREMLNKFCDYFEKKTGKGPAAFFEDLFPGTEYNVVCPIFSDEQKADVLYNYKIPRDFGPDDATDQELHQMMQSQCIYELRCVEVDGIIYCTTGQIFLMNDDGKTIDRC